MNIPFIQGIFILVILMNIISVNVIEKYIDLIVAYKADKAGMDIRVGSCFSLLKNFPKA
ncbi:hypothetical protein [Bacillus sp. NTK034]|uniref:hypothetical protein n=1 Tax=Bacillus sp. NTK034 TaxID=2802176 RepID=UPI001A8F178B|nr:hypothetical protein [Bacillus sp. NTK034]MBN8203136.1 hypothetical protein [Bacillus sp. NTK034]